jgi:hypothetical protein
VKQHHRSFDDEKENAELITFVGRSNFVEAITEAIHVGLAERPALLNVPDVPADLLPDLRGQ